ncbi:hypothetical protein VTO42DRAFT_1658 [Malbranchea cinnamomea]
MELIASYFSDYPLSPSDFGKLGRRIQILGDFIATSGSIEMGINLSPSVESIAISLFPFLQQPRNDTRRPFSALFSRHKTGTRGIVIPVGRPTFRFACHLIGSIRNVFGSHLPIEIAYSGDEDLPSSYRNFLISLGSNIETVDITQVFNDDHLRLAKGKWAIKPFAILASKFEEVVLLDSDSVMLQPPDVLFGHQGFQKTGVLLFRDRLIFKGAYPDRHAWWEEQMKHTIPSSNYLNSLVHREHYSEEGESGLVVVNKGNLNVFLGLLHVAWQNSEKVRNQVTYKMGYGDKESWWLAFELCKVPYSFEHRYAAIIGEVVKRDNVSRVCSFTIAHVDDKDEPLWLNGSLLKNKALNETEFWIPEAWMADGEWEKGFSKSSWSCKKGGRIEALDKHTIDIFRRSVDQARRLDNMMRTLLNAPQ